MNMAGKRRKLSRQFKAKVALEAVKGLKTTAQLAAEHQVHPGQISTWKRQLLDGAEQLFAKNGKSGSGSEEKRIGELYEEIGRLKMDIKWLEKKL
jgi:transposase-like protein